MGSDAMTGKQMGAASFDAGQTSGSTSTVRSQLTMQPENIIGQLHRATVLPIERAPLSSLLLYLLMRMLLVFIEGIGGEVEYGMLTQMRLKPLLVRLLLLFLGQLLVLD